MAKSFARTFGQDLMRGEHTVGGGMSDGHPAVPGRATSGLAESSAYTPSARKGLAIGTNEWVNKKIAEGDIEGGMSAQQSGTSIFDPVLCELIYKWFCPPGGKILDPFAGGSVRGIVASVLGFQYRGIELRPEQVAANRAQLHIAKDPAPEWVEGDARDVKVLADGHRADLLFSCPPYADLERYSDDPRDLSTLDYAAFVKSYSNIIAASAGCMAADSFACFVVGDARDKRGNYYGFPEDTVNAFRAAGLKKYNEAVLITAVGSLPIRVGRQFRSGRKLGKTHQNILVFVKGDSRKAAGRCNADV